MSSDLLTTNQGVKAPASRLWSTSSLDQGVANLVKIKAEARENREQMEQELKAGEIPCHPGLFRTLKPSCAAESLSRQGFESS